MQRRHWALEVLRKESVRSVMDIGCGPGSLLQTLVMPPSTIAEKPIRGDDGNIPDGKELFIRVSTACMFVTTSVMPAYCTVRSSSASTCSWRTAHHNHLNVAPRSPAGDSCR